MRTWPAFSGLLGAIALTAAMAAFAASDVMAKTLSKELPAQAIAGFRFLVLLLAVSPLALRRRSWSSQAPGLQALRGVLIAGSALVFVFSLGRLPVAEATAISFSSPMMITVLAAIFLKERVTLLRWVPVVLGFVGALIVVRPKYVAFGGAALLPLLSSSLWAVAVILTRHLSALDRVITTIFCTAAVGTGLFAFSLATTGQEMLQHAPLLLAMAVAWCAAHWLTILAYHFSDASSLAPFAYTQLVWATLFGWIFFRHFPDLAAGAGIGVILIAGLIAAWGAQRLRRAG